MSNRTDFYYKLLEEGLKKFKLLEVGEPVASNVPPSNPTTPPPDPNMPPAPTPGAPTGGEMPQLTIDTVITKLNTIRRGKSFNDEPLYDQLSNFFNALSEQDKASLDRLLSQIGQIVVSNLPQPVAPTPASQMPPSNPTAPPAPSPQIPVNEFVKKSLNEAIRMTETVKICGGNEVPFGSKEHVADLQRTLDGLEVIKTHWDRGTSSRYLVGSVCARIRKLVAKLMANNGEVA